MEKPARGALTQRCLAALLLAGVLALAWLERGSGFARVLGEGRPALGWLVLNAPQAKVPALFLAVYQSRRRSLDLVYLPGNTRPKGGHSLEAVYEAALKHGEGPQAAAAGMARAAGAYLGAWVPAWRDWETLPLWQGEAQDPSDEPPLDAAAWILRGHEEPWKRLRALWTGQEASSWSRFDRLLLALELQRLRPGAVRPGWLPPEEQIGPLLGRSLMPGPEAAPAGGVTVEVLNASQTPGIASRAKIILRLRGADVMSVGNAAGPQARTLVYDRIGRFENAAAVRGMLGCPSARAVTKVDLKRLVDVTVVLAEDCPLQ